MQHPTRYAGTTLWDVIAAIATLALLAAAITIATRDARRQASLGDNFANLKLLGQGFGNYAADSADRICTFSWQAGPSPDPSFGPAPTDLAAAGNQAIEILRRRAGRTEMTAISNWFVHMLYSPLVLADYLDAPLPAHFLAAPEDRQRLLWQAAIQAGPQAYLALSDRPGGTGFNDLRWAYSSSYELAPAFFAPDARSLDPAYSTVEQATSSHSTFYTGSTNLPMGRRRFDEVSFPSHKIMMFEQFQRHFGPMHLFFNYPAARVPALFTDGAARIVPAAAINISFQPNSPHGAAPSRITYTPAPWEPPAPNQWQENHLGRQRWTRSGLRGRDVAGPDIPWVD